MAWRKRLDDLPVTRRQLFTGAAIGGGLLVAWWAMPRSYESPLEPGPGEHGFGAWLTIAEDGIVTVAVPQLEMGQGVTTLLPQIVAHELGADWRLVGVIPAPPSGTQPNIALAARWAPLWSSVESLADDPDGWWPARFARDSRFNATADGTTLAAYEGAAREAAAAARAMLAMAAADQWDVAWEECEARGGFVIHGDKRARFGDLAGAAAEYSPPDPAPLRPQPAAERPLPGEADAATDFPRLDLPAKVDGSYLFAGDVRLPAMLHASVRHGPVGLTELTTFDEEAARNAPGVIAIVKAKRWIATVAESWWQADRALTAMRPRFAGPEAVESEGIGTSLDNALKQGEAERIASWGDPAPALDQPSITRRYDIAPALHAGIETASATAHYHGDRLELWIASQAPEAARKAAAKAVGLALDDVVLYPMGAGGSFDARLERQHAIEAAQIAREIGRPIQLTWPRGEEAKIVPPRAPAAIEISARLDDSTDRQPLAWASRIACPATVREFGHRLFDNNTPEAALRKAAGKTDPLACEGAAPPYSIPGVAVDHANATIALPTGRLRGNSHGYTAFANECFIDELAREAGRDPFLYRMALLGDAPRMAEVLSRATRLGEWDGGSAGSGEGLAMMRMETFGDNEGIGGGRIACVARAQLAEGGLRVTRLAVVADIGRIVNLDLARQQIEGGLLFGVGLAAGCSARWQGGRPVPAGLGAMKLPTLSNAPEILLDFVESDAPPFDPGELGVCVAPPAIANALFSATGRRFRTLPLTGANE